MSFEAENNVIRVTDTNGDVVFDTGTPMPHIAAVLITNVIHQFPDSGDAPVPLELNIIPPIASGCREFQCSQEYICNYEYVCNQVYRCTQEYVCNYDYYLGQNICGYQTVCGYVQECGYENVCGFEQVCDFVDVEGYQRDMGKSW